MNCIFGNFDAGPVRLTMSAHTYSDIFGEESDANDQADDYSVHSVDDDDDDAMDDESDVHEKPKKRSKQAEQRVRLSKQQKIEAVQHFVKNPGMKHLICHMADQARPNVRHAIEWAKEAWDSMPLSTIQNCWNSAKILPCTAVVARGPARDVIAELQELLTQFSASGFASAEEMCDMPDER